MSKKICVFCGSSNSKDNIIIEETKNIGKIIASNNMSLVYGGAKIGLMGLIANEVLKNNGKVIGVIPKVLYKKDYNDRSVMETINYIHHVTTDLGQRIYKPIDVKGWQRDEAWLNGSTMIFRMKALDDLIMRLRSYKKNQLLDFVRDLTNNSKDPAFISRSVVDHFLSKPLSTKADYTTVESVLKWQVPSNYYKLSKWSLDWNSAEYQVLMLFKHLLTIPEFQLK